MQLSVTVGAVAVVLGVVLAAGYALGGDDPAAVSDAQAAPQTIKGPARGGASGPDSAGGA